MNCIWKWSGENDLQNKQYWIFVLGHFDLQSSATTEGVECLHWKCSGAMLKNAESKEKRQNSEVEDEPRPQQANKFEDEELSKIQAKHKMDLQNHQIWSINDFQTNERRKNKYRLSMSMVLIFSHWINALFCTQKRHFLSNKF